MNAEDSLKLARRFIGLPLEKRQLFLAALHKEGVDFARFPIPAGVEAEDRQALSFAQQRMWFLWQLDPHSGAYNLPGAVRLTGHLNLHALEQVFASLVERHETLRTVFQLQADDSLLQVPARTPLVIDHVDFSALPAPERELAVAQAAEQQSVQPFDLAVGPLLRVTLLKLADQEHVLLLTLHHIVSDGWSMNVLIDEFIRCYDAFDVGAQPQLTPLPIQYSDYALWQRRWLEAGEQARQLDYWQAQLGNEHPVLELPTDHPRPAMPSYRGTRYEFAVDAQLAEQLRATAQKHTITLFMLLLGAFNALLHRYTGQTDLRVGVPIANRNRAEIEGLIGFFVNTQVLRTQLDGQTRVDDLLRAIKETALGAQAHQDLPFERLVEALKLERSLSHTPLFQVMYNHQPQVADIATVSTASGLALGVIEWEGRTTQFDLTLDTYDLNTNEKRGKLYAALTYANDLFDADTIARMAQHWTHLLQGMVSDPTQRVSDLPLLESAEYQRIVHDWNHADEGFPQDLCIHELISQQVAANPNALAVTFGTKQLTYAELDIQANHLAHKLIELGVGPEVRVGVAMPRSENLLVALLAVLKAGGAYVPLDPDYPVERVAYMLEDSRALVLLTEQSVAATLTVTADTQVLLLDDKAWVEYPANAPQTRVTPDNLAYVIYTSGSTGKPKGVAIAHRNVLALIDWSTSVYSREDIQGVLASTSVCFDLSVWELFVTLANGGSVIIARNALELPQLPARDQVRLINTVPSAINALQRDGQIPPSVRIINLAGEPLKQSLVEALYQQPTVEHVYDLYGPSEDTTYSTWTRREAGGRANIGRPLKHTVSYLLDAELQPVPQGVSAELYLSGAGITRGYLARPGMTAEKYVPNPFASNGERLYRTGDLTRYQADGTLQYVGRIDHQVKVRGFRIELGEIEARLLQQDTVREVAVLAQDSVNGQQLVAYVVPNDPALLDDADAQSTLRETLKAALRQHLPDYMVPAFLLFLDHLRLTPNGKLDRKALPAVDGSQQQREHVAPRSALEKSLAAIWQDVLAMDNVGLEDNFFELGGDSIVSMQVVSRARQAGIVLSPKDLFQHQTIRSLAQAARSGEQPLIDQCPAQGVVVLAPVQQWFFEQAIPERQHWNQSLLLVPREVLNAEALDRAIEQLLSHHDSLRLRYEQTVEGWQQIYAAPTTESVLWQCQAQSLEELNVLCDEAQRSLDLHNGPLMRTLLVAMADGTQRLLLVIHHLVVDGVSWRVLLEDLQQFYRGNISIAKTSSYQRWVARLQAHVPAFESSHGYWLTQLNNAPNNLPCDRPNGALENRFEHKIEFKLDAEHTRKLLQNASAAYRTQVNDLLLTALTRAVCRWSRQGSALIQLEGHGREDLFDDIDLTRTVGWFTSLFPVNLVPSSDLGASVKSIKEQLRGVPDKGLGYGALRYLGSPTIRTELEALPQPRITFNYLGQFDRQFDDAAMFVPSTEGNGVAQDPSAPLGNWLTVEGQVYGGELSLSWGFSREMFDIATIQRLADDYALELKALIDHCCAVEMPHATPSDFPLARISQMQLDALPVATLEDLYPLSPMQQGMLFHTLYEPHVGAYISQLRLDIQGLDPQRFAQAWQTALERHDILRSSFHWQGLDTAHQAIVRQVELPLEVLDATDTDALADAERAQGFELGSAPLFRLKLVRTDSNDWHLIYTSHHILMDGWSNAQLLAEVIQHYATGQSLPTPTGQYRDYLGWLQQQSAVAGEQFWKAALTPLEAPTLLAEALRPPVGARGSEEYRVALDSRATQRLADFAWQQKVTLNTVLQAAWSLLLHRYTGQDCVVFGATVAGRSAPLSGIEEQLGLFINTLPLVCAMNPEQTVSQWLSELQGLNLAMREFEHVPLYDIQGWAGQQGSALFDSLLVFENFPVAEALKQGAPAGLSFGNLHNHERTHYPLTLGIELGEGLSLEFSYDAARFSAAQVAELSANLQHLLMQLVALPDAALGALELLDIDGKKALLAISQPAPVQLSTTLLVHEQIAAQAAVTPQALALQVDSQSLSYTQLNTQANRLAHRLIENGAGPGKRVGLALHRSPQLIVSLLAVLKSGAAYVPLDPKYPAERLTYMIDDSCLDVLLCETGLLEDVPGVLRLSLDDNTGYSDSNPPNHAVVEDLAYVIYTSGSTGQPKGVAIAHAALREFCQSAADYSVLSAVDRVLQFATVSFDGFVEQCFPALCVGAALIMRGDELWDAGRLAAEIVQQGVTVADLPAAYWYLLARECASGVVRDLGDLRQVHVGGEAMSVEGLRLWHQASLSHVRLLNTYGPTEATVVSSVHECRLDDANDAFGIPIGRAIAGRALYVLDAAGQLLPNGGVGELCIGAPACLAQSYFDRPALTAERFLPDPFAREPGARLYRSGDLARYNADGHLEYVGRIDHQVKIRGFRIEMGEIEACLQACEDVRDAAVIAQDGTQLVAYVVASDAVVSETEYLEGLKAVLRRSLPEYMVPSYLILLVRLPLNNNGKLDRRALPRAEASDVQRDFVAPVEGLETKLALIWAEVLQVERVGRDDNFFELGGHSLLVLQVISRVRQQLQLELSVSSLFSAANLAEFAERGALANVSGQPVLQRAAVDHPQILSYAQQRQWILWQLDPQSPAYNIPAALRLKGSLNLNALRETFTQVQARHQTLRTTFEQDGQQAHSVLHDTLALQLEQRTLDQSSVESAVAEEIARPFDLRNGPLWRVLLLQVNTDEHVLVLTVHHIAADGWSMQVMVDEFSTLYQAAVEGRDANLNSLPVSYSDYAHWQRDWLEAGEGARQLAWWSEQLKGNQTPLELPSELTRPARRSERGASLVLNVDRDLLAGLRQRAQEQQVTLFMLLLASFQTLLHRQSGQSSISVGVPSAGRSRLETEGLIGFFINTQVLRAEIDGQQPFSTLLQQVKQVALDAQANQDVPFEQLVDALQPDRSLNHSPLFQVLYNHQQQMGPSVERNVADLQVERLHWLQHTAQFDLVLDTQEQGEELDASLTYATDVYDEASMQRLAEQWLNLLRAVVNDPQQRVAELPLLHAPQNDALIQHWNPAFEAQPPSPTIHRLFETQAAQRPNAIALVHEGEQLSYAALNAQANRLARKLREQGVGPEVRVGIATERAMPLVVGLLAILKAGGAYVPLDPQYPAERLSYMIEDSGITLLLTQQHLIDGLPSRDGVQVLSLESLHLDAFSDDNLTTLATPDNLAYVIYTSGSTGRPKGALLSHANVGRLLTATASEFNFGPADVWTLFHSYAFDFSVWELFGSLCTGGRLVIVPHDISREPQAFHRLLCDEGVTVLNQTPSAFRQLLPIACGSPRNMALRQVIFGGEVLEVASLRPWFERFGDQQPTLVNMYGITETTVHVTYRAIRLADLDGKAQSPIGLPIRDLRWYLLDSQLQPVPVGVAGELYIAGAGLARGYHGRCGLTAERFVPSPFDVSQRLYRSGDLARQRGDGSIDYLGRIDQQVKIRGFRIELGEIEAALLAQPSVRQAVLNVHNGDGGPQLCAYVVAEQTPHDPMAWRDNLRAALKVDLPDYMVPSHWLLLDALPLTANGKLDRKALPVPDAEEWQRPFEAPEGDLEPQLAAIWADVLGVAQIGRRDNFFELGGHSLLAAQASARVELELGIELPLRALFESTDLQVYAAMAGQHAPADNDARLDALESLLDEMEIN